MLKLYVKTGCPYCAAVLKKVEEDNIQIEELNIAEGDNLDKLIELGGKRQVPYLIDEEQGVSMYESGDIIEHLDKHYGSGTGAPAGDSDGGECEGGVCNV